MAERISFGDTLILKGEKLLLDNGANDGIIKSKNGTLKIDGNLTVTGITTTVDSETVTMQDNIIVLNSNAIGSATEDSGIEIERGDDTNVSILWDETDNKWTVGSHIFVASTFEGNLTGNSAGVHTGNVTGDVISTGTSDFTNALIWSGTINDTTIGAVTPSSGSFTTISSTTGITGNVTGNVTGTVTSIANHSTSDLSEGTNLYYTQARVDARYTTLMADANYQETLDGQFGAYYLDYTNFTNTPAGSSYGDTDVASYLFGNLDTHIIPDTNNTYDIGSASFKIRDLYVSDNSLHIGNNTLRTSGNNLLLNGEDVMDYANFKNKPTTLAGFGITDGGGAEQDFAIHTADFNATSGSRHAVDTSSVVVTATLPASPATGDALFFADAGGEYATNNLIIGRNGNTIMGSATDMTVNTNNQSFGLFYNGSTWRIY